MFVHLDACTMNLVIYRCKAFLNRVKNLMVSNQSPSTGQGKVVTKGTYRGLVKRGFCLYYGKHDIQRFLNLYWSSLSTQTEGSYISNCS